MDKNNNKYIAVSYKLYTVGDGETKLVEETSEDKPFCFISGFGITLEDFEKEIVNVKEGEAFDFTLTKEKAYGDYEQERVLDLDKEMFCINGHFDHDNIYVDATVPLQNEDGNQFYGRVLNITEDKVKMDLNHPLAGKDLNFKGTIIQSREATADEIQQLINSMSGDGCGCGSCGGGCDCDHEDGDNCGCGHCH